MEKITIYQVMPRHFGNFNTRCKQNGSIDENGCGKFNSFTAKALQEIKSLGITHIWFTGIIEHATQTDYSAFGIKKDHPAVVKGKAGSPYAIKDYYDCDPDLAVDVDKRMKEFENLVARTHKANMQVIIDFIPNHVARQYESDAKPTNVVDLGENDCKDWAFSPLNNFYYIVNENFKPSFDLQDYQEFPARATGNNQFTASPSINDWYETIKLNYGVNYAEDGAAQFDPIPDTWHKMLQILQFWASKKIDGFRCDMAEMVPAAFWGWAIPQVKQAFPHLIFIAEVYNPALYRTYLWEGKFDYLYDKVGLYDTLRNIVGGRQPASAISACWQQVSDIQNNMLNFLENHDEQRIASDFFCGDAKLALPAMVAAATLTKAPIMIYAGQELGEKGMDSEGFSGCDGRTSIFDYWGVSSVQAWVNKGKFDGAQLHAAQKEIRHFYQQLLTISVSHKAISAGELYDLQYANFDNPYFNTNKQFAYFRAADDELLLIILNFEGEKQSLKVNIPAYAFSYLKIPTASLLVCKDLLLPSHVAFESVLSIEQPFEYTLAAHGAAILDIHFVEK
ncbi:MAG: alpha-amylase [Porphyromonadaceae bacterium CG2_30_38_12]|nr:MAG: alpha-amylase [Porphyromonadaceae bacterium CG2_30_38_12]